jgi:hypothetical protein
MALTSNPFTTVIAGKTVIAQYQTKSRYVEAVNQLTPLTMLTADEVKSLSIAGQQLVGTDETLIYKYREEFLHVQQVAEKGLTTLDLLVEDPSEFKIVAEAWGFTVTVKDKYTAGIVYTKNLNQTEFKTQVSNVNIDWNTPRTPTIDVAYYRNSGNLQVLADSTLVVPNIQGIEASILYARKVALGITDNTQYNKTILYPFTKSGSGVGGQVAINISNGSTYNANRVVNGGTGYLVGDVITFPGTRLGSTNEIDTAGLLKAVVHTLTIRITSVDIYGAVINFTCSGVGGATWGYTVLDLQSGAVTGYAT